MPGIIIHILLIIGKILLILVAVVLVLLLLILFLPIVYRGTFTAGSGNIRAGGSASWFFRLIYVKADYDSGTLSYELYLFGIPVLKLLRLRRKKHEAAVTGDTETVGEASAVTGDTEPPNAETALTGDKDSTEDESVLTGDTESTEDESALTGDTELTEEKNIVTEDTENAEEKEVSGDISDDIWKDRMPEQDTANQTEEMFEEEAFLDKICRFFDRMEEACASFSGRISSAVSSAASAFNKITSLLEKIFDEDTGEAFGHVFSQLIKLLRSYLPRRIEGTIEYSAGDPALTGRILGAYYTFCSLCPNDLIVAPDFEEEKLKADADIRLRGHIILFVLVYRGVIVILNRSVRRTIRMLRGKNDE